MLFFAHMSINLRFNELEKIIVFFSFYNEQLRERKRKRERERDGPAIPPRKVRNMQNMTWARTAY